MAAEYKHNEYFRLRLADSSLVTFSNVAEAQTACGFHNTYLTSNSPTITYALEDSNQTLKVTLEFADSAKQEAWKTAVSNLTDSSTAWHKGGIEWFKVEWLHQDGSVSATQTF